MRLHRYAARKEQMSGISGLAPVAASHRPQIADRDRLAVGAEQLAVEMVVVAQSARLETAADELSPIN
jgi:hypothetical protein